MAFKVALEFDGPDDFIALVAKLTVPDPGMSKVVDALISLERKVLLMSASIQNVIDALSDNVQRLSSVEDSVQAFVEGVPGLIQAAVDQALAAGATPEQMQALNDLNTQLSAKVDELASNVVANTPAAPAEDPAPAPADGGDTVPAEPMPAPDAPAPDAAPAGEGTPPDATPPAEGTTVPPATDPAISPQA